jgi:hypothetical protein
VNHRRLSTATTVTLAVVMAATVLAGCGKDEKKVAYRPTSFGENGQCYYVDHPDEALALQRNGLCDPSWAPTVMPVYWRQMYHPYYASPAYYRSYVPVATRTVYVDRQKTWGSANRTAIAEKAKGATYLGSNGKTVAAEKIGATKYGAGNRFGDPATKFGGGSRGKTPSTTPATTPVTAKTPTNADTPKADPKATPTPKPKAPSPPKASNPKPQSPKPQSPSRPSGGYGGGSRGGGSYGGKR